MKKNVLTMFASAAVLLFTACSSDDIAQVAQTTDSADAVSFGVLTQQAEPTRAGYPGEIGMAQLRNVGFGVYAYVESSGLKWDFMYNQQVRYSGGWTYSPIKYWPNGTTSSSYYPDVTFMAYAPYVDDNSLGSEGITRLPQEDQYGRSTTIEYKVPEDPADCVDLLYGVAARDYDSHEFMGSGSYPGQGDAPIILNKMVVGDKVEWEFKHALTKFGVTVDAVIDDVRTGNNGSGYLDPNTRILIESIEFNGSSSGLNLWKVGSLDLANPENNNGMPYWSLDAGSKFDAEIADNLKYPSSFSDFYELPLGVTSSTQSLFGKGTDPDNAFMLILGPSSSTTELNTVKVTYHVITKDDNVSGGYTDITNEVEGDVDMSFGAGLKTMLHLHLGLTSVKMDATTKDWNSTEGNVDLPKNKKVTSLDVSGITIDGNGKVSGRFTAYLSDGSNTELDPNYLTFKTGSTTLPVFTDASSNYYIEAFYATGSTTRDVYPYFAGFKGAKIEQSNVTTLTLTSTDVALSGGISEVTADVNPAFNLSDWTITTDKSDVYLSSQTLDGSTVKLKFYVPANNTARDITVTMRYKNGFTTTGTIQQKNP